MAWLWRLHRLRLYTCDVILLLPLVLNGIGMHRAVRDKLLADNLLKTGQAEPDLQPGGKE